MAPPQPNAAPGVGQTTPQFTTPIRTQLSDAQSPPVSQGQSRRVDVQLAVSRLVGDAQLQQLLGVPPDVLLKTAIASEPPALPTPHLSRSSIFPSLARTFDSHRVVAVTGYPECGKTVAMAEFAAFYPGDVFWFSVARSETHTDAWLGLFCFALAQYVGADSFLPNEIRSGLVDRQNPLLLVIDNVQHCHDLDALSFLVEAAEATPAISVLLVGTDEPASVSAVRSRGIVDWRLPGLTEQEAQAIVELAGDALSNVQLAALEFLRLRVDGHLGMLKLSRQAIRRIQTVEQRNAFISQISSALGPGLDSLQSAMIERLREGLHDDEVDLCRRLSIVVGSFPRRVGERVWGLDRPMGDFHKPWNGCVLGVFESQPSGRYILPDLYRDGFRQEADKDAIKLWHGAVADGFGDREGDSLDVFDVYAAVIHRFLSGNVTAALDSASMYLAFARGPYARKVQAFLIGRFEVWLAHSARDATVPITQRLRWHAIRVQVYTDLNRTDRANSATHELHDLLRTDPSDAAPEAVVLGWAILLLHASRTGQPELALSALNRIERLPIPVFDVASLPWREFFVISAYLSSSTSPLPFLRTVIKDRAGKSPEASLWGTITGYDFWRAVIAIIYSRSGHCRVEQGRAAQLADEIQALANDCRTAGESEIACLFECLLVHVYIDLIRDFARACATSQLTAACVAEMSDACVAAYVHDTRGDALRCFGRDDEAVACYLKALELWSDSEFQDKAETLSMLGISQAKSGRFHEGIRSACAAANLYAHSTKEDRSGTLEVAAARCLLEGAAFAIRAKEYSRSSRCLVAAHVLLNRRHRDKPEWPALAQVAWALTNRLNPDPINPQPPAPGFTLGLGDIASGTETMVSSAATMMLARACAAVGRPHRALGYFEAVLAECDTCGERMLIGVMALDMAIQIEDLGAATKYAALGSDWLVHPPPKSPKGSEAFVFDHLIGRTVQLASIHKGDQQLVAELDRAVSAVAESRADNPATQLLANTLKAYRAARVHGDDAALEDAFQLALQHRALWVARDIAWHWCFRFSLSRPAYESQYFLWHWRLCWLSAEIGSSDAVYLAGVLEQERSYWNHMPEESRSETTTCVLRVLGITDESPRVALQRLVAELATIACTFFNVTDVSREVAAELRLTKEAGYLARPLDALYIRLLDLVLRPGAPYVLSRLQEEIASVAGALGLSTASGSEALDRFKGLEALAKVVEVGTPSELAFQGLRIACAKAPDLTANSAAQLYIWLRHFAQFAPKDFGFERINEILRCTHVVELLGDKDLLPYVRIRLATCRSTAVAFDAQRRLGRALAVIATQKAMRSPIARSAITSAVATRDSALKELEAIVKEFETLEAEASHASLNAEIWSCCQERGNIRRLTGSILLQQAHEESAKDRWLVPSLKDFRKAVKAAKLMDCSQRYELVLKAAFSGQGVARAVNDQSALAEFTEVIDEVRSMGGYDEIIAVQESVEATDILNVPDRSRPGRSFLAPDDEESIQQFTNHMMQSTGWPEDRRRFVEDDVRKMARIEQEQDGYCQHLQPLQNLLHTDSPLTVYASPTKYTCSCTLLGHETRIETEDIETVIVAMKRVYCANCQHRSPRQGE